MNEQEKTQVLDTVLRVLNEAVAADSAALDDLIVNRVNCNDALAAHPTVQVYVSENGENPTVGTLGILNGIIEELTGRRIAAVWDDSDKLIGFIPYRMPSEGQL